MTGLPKTGELPVVVADNIASWRRTIAKAAVADVREVLRNAAGELFTTEKIAKTVSPESTDLIHEAITTALADMAERAGISADDAQQIFSEATKPRLATAKANGGAPAAGGDGVIIDLANMTPLQYAQARKPKANELGIPVAALDKIVKKQSKQSRNDNDQLPHWKVVPWPVSLPGAELLNSIVVKFEKYFVLPAGGADAFALWTLHSWTMDADDVSPFLVLISPTKRCGKTNILIALEFLTPRSVLASNITSSALFRYIEDVRPTLLIDEADSFLTKDNEEMRGVLNSGHTKAAAFVIRNVEVEGEHKPKRFSTWAPKAIATIRELADTLQDRSIVIQIQRKSRTASVERFRKRDDDEFALLRQKIARWSEDNFARLTNPDPQIPETLDDRGADNWRPLLAIADLAGGDWPRRARDAACMLSGEGHDAPSINVELLADIRKAFGDDDAIRSADLCKELTADPERPWVEWYNGKPITPKQLGALLRPFGIISETVRIAGLSDAKGYLRRRFEDAWERYSPGQTPSRTDFPVPKRPTVLMPVASAQHDDFRNVQEAPADGSKNSNLSYSHAGLDAWTDKSAPDGAQDDSATSEGGLRRRFVRRPPGTSDRPGSDPDRLSDRPGTCTRGG
jgi:putative DNA primase/helicase